MPPDAGPEPAEGLGSGPTRGHLGWAKGLDRIHPVNGFVGIPTPRVPPPNRHLAVIGGALAFDTVSRLVKTCLNMRL